MRALLTAFFLILQLTGTSAAAAPVCAQAYSSWSVRKLGGGVSGTAYLHENPLENRRFVEKIYNMPSQREADQKAFHLLHHLEEFGGGRIAGLRILKPEWLALEIPAQGGRPIAKSRMPYAEGPTLEQALQRAHNDERSRLQQGYERTLERLLKLCLDSGFCRGKIERDDFDGSVTLMMGGLDGLVMIKPDNLVLDRGSQELTVVDPF